MATEEQIQQIVAQQREYFATGKTMNVQFRVNKLRELKETIKANEDKINAALQADLCKSPFESYMCEVGMTLAELSCQIKNTKKWSKGTRYVPDLANFHSSYRTVPEPYGQVLIMSPWNYPFMLTMEPLAGAIAAGNCCVVKPSAYSPATSQVMADIIAQVFEPGHVQCVLGGRAENTALLEARWDYIFFTGSPTVGKMVMEKASRYLTPVSLELGGKSPCVIAADANLKLAAQRLAFGKWLNVGQTCIAPDYVLVEESVHDKFVAELKAATVAMYGSNAFDNPNYGKIVNEKHYQRIMGLIDPAKVVLSAEAGFTADGSLAFGNPETLQIAPVIMTGVTADDAVMGEEIFGPLCPILKVRDLAEAEAFIKEREKPLALYLFSNSKATQERFMRHVPFGVGCINDTIVHIATSKMGFGGVGNSGMGSYHGIRSFRTFSHEKSVLRKHNWIDLPMRYQPYSSFKEKLIRMFLR